MNPSHSYHSLTQRSKDLPRREIRVTPRLNSDVYRYSYNLGILELRTRWKQNAAASISKRQSVETQSGCIPSEYKAFEKLRICRHNHAGQNTTVSTGTNVAPKTLNLLKETETHTQDNSRKKQELLSTTDTINAHKRFQKMYVTVRSDDNDSQESVETRTVIHNTVCNTKFDYTQECSGKEEHIDGQSGNFERDFYPPIEKFCRAARVLGVCLPSKELHSIRRRRRDGICEGNDNCLEHSTLLRILNKRF